MSASRYKRRADSTGLTLIEVIVVLMIILISAAVVVPRLKNSEDQEVLSAARLLTADLQYAQDVAITYQQPITVTFNTTGESYVLSNASGNLIHPITKSEYVVQFGSLNNMDRVDLYSANFVGATSVEFDETGAPDNAGTVELRAGDFRFQVQVASFTGKVTVLRVGA